MGEQIVFGLLKAILGAQWDFKFPLLCIITQIPCEGNAWETRRGREIAPIIVHGWKGSENDQILKKLK